MASSPDMSLQFFESLNPSTLWDFFVRAWSAIGPLVGVLIGAWLARSWQQKQWLLDSKKAEYRELISTLSRGCHLIMKNLPVGRFGAMSGEQEKEARDAWVAGLQVIQDRSSLMRKCVQRRSTKNGIKLQSGEI